MIKWVFLISALIANIASAGPVSENGTVGGGGGGVLQGPAVESSELWDIIESSRLELYLFFVKQDGRTQSPIVQQLLNANPNIFDLIRNNKIQVLGDGPAGWCLDADKNKVYGSIHTWQKNSICLAWHPLSQILGRDEAHSQILGLLAHEYAHLAGFNEGQAEAVQLEVFNLTANEIRTTVTALPEKFKYVLGSVRGAIINHQQNPMPASWDYYCQLSHKISGYLARMQEVDSLKDFSYLNFQQELLLTTYQWKINSLNMGSCGQGALDPLRDTYWEAYNLRFGIKTSMPVSQWAQFVTDKPVDPTVFVRRLSSFEDFEEELVDIFQYLNSLPFINSWSFQN